MTGLSLVRCVGITDNSYIAASTVGKKVRAKATMLAVSILLAAAAVACFPMLRKFEDFFVNGFVYNTKMRLFIGQTTKDTHFDVLHEYYGRMKEKTLKWELINTMVNDMFSRDYNQIAGMEHRVDFYGNEGVCLFKYFVTSKDPQKMFTGAILILNIICFGVISVSYILINRFTAKTTSNLQGMTPNMMKVLIRRNKKTQRKVSTIILTDFLCWIPFVVVSGLHYGEVIDATSLYGLTSIVLLPINSVINPLIYKRMFVKRIKRMVKYCQKKARGTPSRREPENIEMQVIRH